MCRSPGSYRSSGSPGPEARAPIWVILTLLAPRPGNNPLNGRDAQASPRHRAASCHRAPCPCGLRKEDGTQSSDPPGTAGDQEPTAQLREWCGALLDRAQQAGAVRDDVDTADVQAIVVAAVTARPPAWQE
ncbi:SbtR family transcriptional regulator [Streptomyces sp. NPDC054783]